MIKVNCKRCRNCTGEECKLYGDDPVKAAQCCAHDRFTGYIPVERKKRKREGDRRNGVDRKQ